MSAPTIYIDEIDSNLQSLAEEAAAHPERAKIELRALITLAERLLATIDAVACCERGESAGA